MPEGQEPAQAPSGQELQAPPPAPPAAPPTGAQEPPKAETFDAAYVKQLRDEAAATRLKLKAAEEKVKEHEQAQLSEAEKLQKAAQEATARADTLAQELRTERGRTIVAQEATKAGVKPDLAQKLIALEWNDAGELTTNVKGALDKLIQDNPELVAQVAANGSTTNPARSGSGATNDTEAALLRYIKGDGANPFDLDNARRLGGGVFIKE